MKITEYQKPTKHIRAELEEWEKEFLKWTYSWTDEQVRLVEDGDTAHVHSAREVLDNSLLDSEDTAILNAFEAGWNAHLQCDELNGFCYSSRHNGGDL